MIFSKILDTSEVWALLIPLFVMITQKNRVQLMKPVRVYVVVALLINICIILIQEFKARWGIHEGDFLWSNNFLYNIHSIVRFFLFAWFFLRLKQPFIPRIKIILPILFGIFVILNFLFFEDFFGDLFSNRLLATETALLLFYCLQYYIFLLLEDHSGSLAKQPGFWVVTGLSIYTATCFFIFLFYSYLSARYLLFAITIWDVHNVFYIILCVFLARAIYERNA